jgi:hypothetical protein
VKLAASFGEADSGGHHVPGSDPPEAPPAEDDEEHAPASAPRTASVNAVFFIESK